ncbi:hypothetical protein [Solemya velum gill symbiont]|uniref:hypothetical protein n=1 Tax=Solemya velum gill symbiont TaxID=2340 RepID=UPI0009984AF5|nr:hypothetical protein [Solemya velum gill symbiont]OOZ11930.1 hypothetical protein BOW25_10505 [Solemya velum gill symbiont]
MAETNDTEIEVNNDTTESNEFSYDDYFHSKPFLIFVLLYVDGEKRADVLGIEEEMYESKAKAKEWRNSLVKILHSDCCKHLSADEATAKVNEIYSRMKKHAK